MSAATLPLSSLNPDVKSGLDRHLADFHPSIWKDYFLQYVSESTELDQNIETQIETLKGEVSKMLISKTEKPLEKVDLIDSICRLGVNYHFEHEIDQVLQHIHNNYVVNGEITLQDNLCSLAVLFRLLRQHGFHVSPLVFDRFKNVQGNFSERLASGEDILEEALAFTSIHLEVIGTQLSPSLTAQVNHSLRQALHKNLPRLEARHYISIYEQDASHNEILLTFVKLDFNKLQNIHQKEFGYICKWWNELDVPGRLPYARDRIVESCFWVLAIYFEPQYSEARKIMTKVFALMSIIDDTYYDAYGTIEELELLTKAIEKWDISCLDYLPANIKVSYELLIKLKKVTQAYMIEARWLNSNYKPTTEEYMQTSIISSALALMVITSYIGMGDTATENIFKWVTNEPKIVKASSILCRLMDDIVSNEFEQKRGHVSSFLECYMSEYGESREDAINECQKRITNAWKDINEECLRPNAFSNARSELHTFHGYEDNYTHAGGIMKTYIKALLIDPVPI
ncbi:putative terpene synthase 2, partial [Mucuna pruriens]